MGSISSERFGNTFFSTQFTIFGVKFCHLVTKKKEKGPTTITKDFMKKNPPNLPHV